jgi:hypothetical protein
MFSQSTGGCFGQFALEESLDRSGDQRQLTPLLKPPYVKSLQHHWIETFPRQRHSSPRHGEEKGRRRSSCH